MNMYLKKDELSIRKAVEADATLLCDWWADGKVMAHAGFPNGLHTDKDNLIAQLNKEKEHSQTLIIEIKGYPVGEMSYFIKEGVAEIGIKICDFTYHHKGYGSSALKLLISFLFEERKANKIILDTNLDNKVAQHVYEKIGFKKISVNHNAWKDQLGVLQSSVDYELDRIDFV